MGLETRASNHPCDGVGGSEEWFAPGTPAAMTKDYRFKLYLFCGDGKVGALSG